MNLLTHRQEDFPVGIYGSNRPTDHFGFTGRRVKEFGLLLNMKFRFRLPTSWQDYLQLIADFRVYTDYRQNKPPMGLWNRKQLTNGNR